MTSRYWIIRRNQAMNSANRVVTISDTTYEHIYIYNNTLVQESNPNPPLGALGYLPQAMLAFAPEGIVNSARVKNNIGYGATTEAPIKYWLDRPPGGIQGVTTDHNLWRNTVTPAYQIRVDETNNYTIAGFQGAYPGQEIASIGDDPLFTNQATRDFTLRPLSPAINAGTTLTATVGGGTGTSVTVNDAGYFSDGYGLIDGDIIRIGTQTVTITL